VVRPLRGADLDRMAAQGADLGRMATAGFRITEVHQGDGGDGVILKR